MNKNYIEICEDINKTNKPVFIFQPLAYGDLCFIQKIINYYANNISQDIIIPLLPEYLDVVEYFPKYDNVKYIDIYGEYEYKTHLFQLMFLVERSSNHIKIVETDEIIFVPLSPIWMLDEKNQMKKKYEMCGLDYLDWSDYLTINRNVDNENELYYDILSLRDNEDYVLVNKYFNTDTYKSEELHPDGIHPYLNKIESNINIVEMSKISGFTVFDWCKVFENAKAIFTVETGILYIMETLDLKAKDLWMFSRRRNTVYGFALIEGLFNEHYWKYAKDNKLPKWEWRY